MPFDDPEPNDPHMLVGVVLPADEAATREMAAAFADEFAQAGLERDEILALYRNSFYAGAHGAWRQLGEDEIRRIVEESLRVWNHVRLAVLDHPDTSEAVEPDPLEPRALVGPNGFLTMLQQPRSCPPLGDPGAPATRGARLPSHEASADRRSLGGGG